MTREVFAPLRAAADRRFPRPRNAKPLPPDYMLETLPVALGGRQGLPALPKKSTPPRPKVEPPKKEAAPKKTSPPAKKPPPAAKKETKPPKGNPAKGKPKG